MNERFEVVEDAALGGAAILSRGEYLLRVSVPELAALYHKIEEYFSEGTAFDKELYDVDLVEVGPKKIACIKNVRAVTGWELRQAKEFVDAVAGWDGNSYRTVPASVKPQRIATAVDAHRARAISHMFLEEGSTCSTTLNTVSRELLNDAKLGVWEIHKELRESESPDEDS